MHFYYDVSGKIYKTRIEAAASNEKCWFYVDDHEYDKVPWQIEPTSSLQDLYRERANWLRKEYDHLILAYSGGSDSTNALESFYYNNILLDEILMVGAFGKDSYWGSNENSNGDYYHNCYPTLQKLNLKNTKLTVVDYTKYLDDPRQFSLIQKYGSEWYKYVGSYYSVNNFFWNDLKKFVGYNNDKKTAVIFGFDKPVVRYNYDTQQYVTLFNDMPFTSYGNFQKENNFERVGFYISPQSTELMRKQLHIVKRFMRDYIVEGNKMSMTDFFRNESKILNRLMYDLKNPLQFQSRKSPTNILSVRDNFLVNYKNTEIYKVFAEAMKKNTEARAYKTNDGSPFISSFTTKEYVI